MALLTLQAPFDYSAWATVVAVAALTVYGVLYRISLMKTHPQEPPIIASAVPFVGPLLGMLLHGGRHVKRLGLANRDKPIFSLPVPGSRIYVVTEPSLAAAVQRASRALSFTPLVPDITRRVLGLDDETVRIVRQNLDPEPGDERGFLADIHDLVYNFLGPGDSLNRFSLDAARELSRRLGEYAQSLGEGKGEGKVVDLLVWVRHFVTTGTAAFLYGARNPVVTHPELEGRFWDFVHGLGPLLVNVAPSVTARKPFLAREAIVAAFIEYLEQGHHLQQGGEDGSGASEIVRKRVKIAEEYGWKVSATARSELSFLFAGIINTATTSFWMVLQIFARPELLASVRAELRQNAIVGKEDEENEDSDNDDNGDGDGNEDDHQSLRLSLAAVRTSCPTLLAVFRECLRLGSDNYSTRLVLEDTLLADRYFLKKKSVVQVAGGVIHADDGIWGRDVAEFNPDRFLPPTAAGKGKAKDKGKGKADIQGQTAQAQAQAAHPAAFRAFGGGKTLCPGRHFATAEALAFVATIVLTFDMEAADGSGRIVVPAKDDRVLPVHVLEPAAGDAVRVRVRPQVGAGGRVVRAVEIVP